MPNIIRIRDLELELDLSGVTIPADKEIYTSNAKRITIDDICDYCINPPPPPGPYFTVTPSTREIAFGGGNSSNFTVSFGGTWTVPKNWWIVGLSARTWATGTAGTYTLSRLSGTDAINTFYGSCASALGPLDSPRNSGPIAVSASGMSYTINVTLTQPIPGYNYPSFTRFQFKQLAGFGLATSYVDIVEVGVGTTVSSIDSIWANTFPSNVIQSTPTSVKIDAGEGMGSNLVNLTCDSTATISFSSPMLYNVPHTTTQYTISGINTIGGSLSLTNPVIRWNYYMYWGTSSSIVLDESGILNLQHSKLIINGNILGEYDFEAPTTEKQYCYWCYPISIDRIDFLENLGLPGTNFAVCVKYMAPTANYAANKYTGSSSGKDLSYISVPMSGSGWINYRIYRSVNNFIGSSGSYLRSYIRSTMS